VGEGDGGDVTRRLLKWKWNGRNVRTTKLENDIILKLGKFEDA
jgi:hypothetical protein